jgi:hypothetical protein
VGKVTYSVKGNVLTVCIPKTMLGIPAEELDFQFGFKWTDNTLEDGDIMQWYLNGDVAPVGRFNYCYTTTGSAEYVEDAANLGNSFIDFTDAAKVEEIKEWMIGEVVDMKYEFTADGLVLTNESKDGLFTLDFSKASPQVVLDRYDSIVVTYKVTNGKTDKMRLGLGTVSNPMIAGRARNVTLVPDGEIHTDTVTLRELRVMEGYAATLGLYFEKNAAAGESVMIQSIQFISSEEAE